MKFSILAMVDEDTRKRIREVILGEAKAFTREQVNATVASELARILKHHIEKFTDTKYKLQDLVKVAVKELVQDTWGTISQKIDAAVEEAADKAVVRKLKNKTVWEAKSQDDYIRNIVRLELHDMVANKMVKD